MVEDSLPRPRAFAGEVRDLDTEELTISSLEHQNGWVHRRVLTENFRGSRRVHPLDRGTDFIRWAEISRKPSTPEVDKK